MSKIDNHGTQADASAPSRVEQRFTRWREDVEILNKYNAILLSRGASPPDLPDATARQAIALLGDHGRETAIRKIEDDDWNLLAELGIIGPGTTLAGSSTPALRFFASVMDAVGRLESLVECFHNAEPTDADGCPDKASGAWGQPLEILFDIPPAATHLQIAASQIFHTASEILFLDGASSGSFAIPCDEGEVELRFLLIDGRVLRHIVKVSVNSEGVPP